MTDPALLERLAAAALAGGRADVAGDLLRAAAAPPGVPDRLHAEGIQHLLGGRPREAELALHAALRGRPAAADWHDHLGVTIAQQGRLAEAAATFRLALRLDPTNAAAAGHLVQTCLDRRDQIGRAHV